MASKIFIGGGGDIEIAKKFDKLFFDSLEYNSKILYIPIAMGATTNIIERCYDWFSSLISNYNEDKNIDFQILKDTNQDIRLTDYDAIYVGGGNTYRLLSKIRQGNFNQKLESYLATNGLYYGGSAGGIILGKSLQTVAEESSVKYKEYLGLNILKEYSIFPHYDNSQYDKVVNLGKKYSLDILAIPEDAGVIFAENKIVTIGEVVKIKSNEN